jgi:cytochrome oxidase Cu insertion factor (SCO1/SenC/PrrC family)
MSKPLLAWLALMLVVMGAIGIALAWRTVHPERSGSSSEPDYTQVPSSANASWLTTFTLTERDGRKLGTSELKRRVHVTNFFFSSCPGPCLTQNKKFEEIQLLYGEQGVQFLSISCDPEVDTPARLRDYARKFQIEQDGWWFLTGDLLYIRRIAAEIYQVPLDKQTHTERFLVTDKWGKLRGTFHWSKPAEITDMKLLLDKLLAETSPPEEPKDVPAGNESAKPQVEVEEEASAPTAVPK